MTGASATPDRVTAVLAERDAIQANLLELDHGYVRQVLEGAALTGQTRQRWEATSAKLAGLWDNYLAYSAVVDQVAALAAARRPGRKELAELDGLLTGPCVVIAGPPVPLARRDLAAAARPPVTLATAVGAMRRSFTEVAEVTAAVEAVWAAIGVPLDEATAELGRLRPLAEGLGTEVAVPLAEAEAALRAARDAANADPLALWDGDRTDISAATAVRDQVLALAPRVAELDGLRRQARHRIEALGAAAVRARADRQDALAAWQEAANRVVPVPPLPPVIGEPPLAGLAGLADAGQWNRLAGELDRAEAALAAAAAAAASFRQSATAAVERRDELRGLLRAYKVKAARLGAAEDEALAARYDQARTLLWTAPCDLNEAEAAVADYQRAILATEGRR
jgi:hypothetical protein